MYTAFRDFKKYKESNKINNIILITGSFGNGFNSWLSEYKDENFKNYVMNQWDGHIVIL